MWSEYIVIYYNITAHSGSLTSEVAAVSGPNLLGSVTMYISFFCITNERQFCFVFGVMSMANSSLESLKLNCFVAGIKQVISVVRCWQKCLH